MCMISMKSMGYVLVGIGFIGALFSLLVDVIGIGDDGIQAAQMLGIEAGIALILLGIGFVVVSKNPNYSSVDFTKFKQYRFFEMPASVWVFAGFVIVYIALFLGPVFLNPERHMVYYNRYIPNTSRIGSDLNAIMTYVGDWLVRGQSPYTGAYIAYPPLALILFAPLLISGFPVYFYILTSATLISYILIALILPMAITKGKDKSSLLLLFIIGLFSYGLQFEIERGQFNLIAFALCFTAIYIFHKQPSLRYFAYILFILSVQLKIYPALFIFMFIDDWRNWKATLTRFIGLGLSNFLLLFILGFERFNEFLGATTQQQLSLTPWNGSSIRSFVFVLSRTGFGVFSEEVIARVSQNPRTIELIFLVLYGVCLFVLIAHAFINNIKEFNPYLFLACTIGVLIVPTISNDYKLPLLIAPMSILFSTWPEMTAGFKRIISTVTLIVVSVAFWSTLYPFKFKPEILHNSMPILLFILLAVGFLIVIAPRQKNNLSMLHPGEAKSL